jgi:hypothetical protein
LGEMTEFGRAAARLDEAEASAGNRPGGPTNADVAATRRLEACLHRLRPQSAQDWRWTAERLARALLNGWTDAAAAPLVGWCAG